MSYQKGWIARVQEYVPGTVIDLQTLSYTLEPCVRVFPHCRPMVQVDETWFYGKYMQILLIAIAQDGN
ncbi:hypothetical protein J1N35_002059 [Gossypium stocksii]|uniref:Uncharacterized protein n=1 Tax=Gossypium stocksii TaxID=47602 RepID=A0A9D4ALW5_9ROSI|nr:hypothetical protein J1N35_002059 [Gossypium stocksii]